MEDGTRVDQDIYSELLEILPPIPVFVLLGEGEQWSQPDNQSAEVIEKANSDSTGNNNNQASNHKASAAQINPGLISTDPQTHPTADPVDDPPARQQPLTDSEGDQKRDVQTGSGKSFTCQLATLLISHIPLLATLY